MARDSLDHPELYAGVRDDHERDARRRLLEYLAESGASPDDLLEAVREGRLSTLPLEYALTPDGKRHTLTDLARVAGVDTGYYRSLVLALGYPNPKPRERIFTDEDVELASTLRRFLDAGVPRDDLVDIAYVVGQAMARTAAAVRVAAADALLEPGDTEADLGIRYAGAAQQLVPLIAPLLYQQIARHLREQAVRDVITRAEREAGRIEGTRLVAATFADLSEFTRLGEHLPAPALARIAARMAWHAAEIARPPVELVKTMGDGVLLVSPDVPSLLAAVTTLCERVEAEGPEFPPMRAGIAFGEAVARSGDWFGPVVNRASRIVGAAKPGTVLVDEEVCTSAGEGWEFKRRRRPKSFKGVDGRIRLYELNGRAAS